MGRPYSSSALVADLVSEFQKNVLSMRVYVLEMLRKNMVLKLNRLNKNCLISGMSSVSSVIKFNKFVELQEVFFFICPMKLKIDCSFQKELIYDKDYMSKIVSPKLTPTPIQI